MAKMNRPHPCPPEGGWWAGRNEERLDVGPVESKEAAITEALYQDVGVEDQDEDGKWVFHIHVGEYERVHVDLSRKFDAADWIEYVEEDLDDDEGPDENGDRYPFEQLTPDDIAALEESVRSAIWHWQHRRGLTLESYWLRGIGAFENVTRPHPDEGQG